MSLTQIFSKSKTKPKNKQNTKQLYLVPAGGQVHVLLRRLLSELSNFSSVEVMVFLTNWDNVVSQSLSFWLCDELLALWLHAKWDQRCHTCTLPLQQSLTLGTWQFWVTQRWHTMAATFTPFIFRHFLPSLTSTSALHSSSPFARTSESLNICSSWAGPVYFLECVFSAGLGLCVGLTVPSQTRQCLA